MNNRHVADKLSAYLDGEVADATQIRTHLAGCPECARHLEVLRAAGEALRTLPCPEPDPHFVTRVLAHVEERPEPRRTTRPLRLIVGTSAAACLGMLYWLADSRDSGTLPLDRRATTADWTDDEMLVDELARRMERGESLAILETGFTDANAIPVMLSQEESIGAIAQVAAECYDSSDPQALAEVDVLMDELTDAELAALRALLEASEPEE